MTKDKRAAIRMKSGLSSLNRLQSVGLFAVPVTLPLNFEDRAGHLPNLLADLIYRLRLPAAVRADISVPARQHGDLRRRQGYTAAMVVEESRILQVSIFNTLQNNLTRVDFSKVLLDVITVADEVDSQLKQAMLGYFEPQPGSVFSAA